MISRRRFFGAVGALMAPQFVSAPTVKLAMHAAYGVPFYGGHVTYYGAGSLAMSMIRRMDIRSAYPKAP